MERLSVVIGAVLIFFIAFATPEPTQTTIHDENVLTFDWYPDVIPENVKISEGDKDRNPAKHLAEGSSLYKEINGKFKLQATNFTTEYPESIAWVHTAGFVDTVFYGYQQHHNVIIRPDDVWTAIIIQFSLYVNNNVEELRQKFVNFEGKKDLVVKFRSRIDRVEISDFIQKIVALIDENIDRSVYDWISPNFTTTTQNDRLTAGVAMMAVLKQYFDYEFWGIICGIPKATILGTVDDWKDIQQRVKKLNEFELQNGTVMAEWSSMLGRILDNFVSVKSGNDADPEFWQQAIRIDYKLIDLVCAKINETAINGWITAFTAFNLAGRWRGLDFINSQRNETSWLKVRTDKISPGIISVPIKIHDEYANENMRDYTGAIITGHMGYSVKKDKVTIQPLSGWHMSITNEVPLYLKN